MVQGKRQLGFLYNDFMNSELTPEKIKEIVINGKIITDNSEIGQKIASSIPKIKKNPELYLS